MHQMTDKIVGWATSRGIFRESTCEKQVLKAVEEMGELARATLKNDQEQFEDAIGDVVVCLVNACHFRGVRVEDCVQKAYNVIAKRTGEMKNGAFVKDGD